MCLDDVGTEVVLDQATKDALVQQHNDLRGQVEPTAAHMPKLVSAARRFGRPPPSWLFLFLSRFLSLDVRVHVSHLRQKERRGLSTIMLAFSVVIVS